MNIKSINPDLEKIEEFGKSIEYLYLTDQIPLSGKTAAFKTPVNFEQKNSAIFESVKEGFVWGKNWQQAWFEFSVRIPPDWQDKQLAVLLDLGGEGLIYSISGIPVQGITAYSVFMPDYKRDVVWIDSDLIENGSIHFWVEATANGMFGNNAVTMPDVADPDNYQARVNKMQLCLFNNELWDLVNDYKLLAGLARYPVSNTFNPKIARNLKEIIDLLEKQTRNTEQAHSILKTVLSELEGQYPLTATAVGHAHIDTAWLWPLEETIRKCARTFSTQVKLIEKYPDYIFGASQPQHYQFVKEFYPRLYSKIKELVKQGRWELQGAMWVEADCNIISGESMIRQILYGKNFFIDEFGTEVKNLWLPDVFGYSAALPQIMKKSGVEFFLTQKISWNEVNEFPHHTFKWIGIDSSSVLTHFPPENDYNSMLSPQFLVPAADRFKEKNMLDEFLSLFGVGDGGGGPKEENLESGRRLQNISTAPNVRFGRADRFFERLAKKQHLLPNWNGELYLEKHRGTLTTQARAKKMNRQLEFRFRQIEMLFSCMPLDKYPQQKLEKLWKLLLINQFHDILPGSSINEVYRRTYREYEQIQTELEELRQSAAGLLFKKQADSLVVFNTLNHSLTDVIPLPHHWQGAESEQADETIDVQANGNSKIIRVTVPALSFLTLRNAESKIVSTQTVPGMLLENELVRYQFDKSGRLISAFDKEINKEMLRKNGNIFSLYKDEPKQWDAWDIDITYEDNLLEHARCTSVKKQVRGIYKSEIELDFQIGNSLIHQKVILSAHSKRLDFESTVEWNEAHKMLRVHFDTNVDSDTAIFDIQYGHIRRNTHRKTSWDKARFEVAAHKYVVLENGEYGVAMLNDCKYGHKVLENRLDLNLLRSPKYPDKQADIGTHYFTYSLLPFSGDFSNSNVIAEAEALNQPLLFFENYRAAAVQIPCFSMNPDVSIEAIKKAEKEKATVIRLVEKKGKKSSTKLIFNKKTGKIFETDLMENNVAELKLNKNVIEINCNPFEIKTIKFY